MTTTANPRRVRTVEHLPGWGWIARDPKTGEEVQPNFCWASRSIARAVVRSVRVRRQCAAGSSSTGGGWQ